MSEPMVSSWSKLEAVERFFVRSRSYGGAAEFSAEADFDGLLDAEVMRKAVEIVIPLHPLLCSTIHHSDGQMTWKSFEGGIRFQHQQVPLLNKFTEGCSFLSPPQTIDLSSNPGVKVKLTTSSNSRSRLRFEYHHACTDGQGGARFFRDVTMVYAGLVSGNAKQFSLENAALNKRGFFAPPHGEPPIGAWEGLRNLWVTVRGKNHRLERMSGNDASIAGTSDDSHLVAQFLLDSQRTEAFQEFLLRSKYVMNDFLLSAAFMTLRKCSSVANNSYVNILNPVDLRTWSDRRSPASNRVGFAYIRRRNCDWDSPENLLVSVADQLRYVRKRGAAAELMKGIELVERVPRALRWIEQSGQFTPTVTVTCMSNLQLGRRHGVQLDGDQWKLAGAKVDRIACIAPLPAGVPLAITVTDANGSIVITMRGNRSYFDEERLTRFGEVFCSSCDEICK